MGKTRKGPVTKLKHRVSELEQECVDYKDKYVRSLAEFENYRRRTQREFETVRQTAIEGLLAELVSVLDNFDRAVATTHYALRHTQHAAKAGTTPQDKDAAMVGETTEAQRTPSQRLDKVHEGIVLIRRQLQDALARHGLVEFSCLGEEFDPRRAEAVSFVHTDEHQADTVVEEHCKGYCCEDRVIRPARVVVAKPRAKARSATDE